MAIGEKVKVAGDRIATLTDARKRTNGPEKVYNFEVWLEHNYFVGKEGVVVHNNYLSKITKLLDYKKWRRTHPDGSQDEESIAYFMERLQEGDLFKFYKEPILTTIYNGKTYLLSGHHRFEAAKRIGYSDLQHMDIFPTPEALSSLTRYKTFKVL
jgi:hypothetical protein